MERKKVLIVTYYWPPAGGPGVQRWLKFVKYLPEFGVEPIVYIPKNPNYPLIDDSLTQEVSEDLTIISQPINEPYKLASFFSKKSNTISKGIIQEKDKQSFIERAMLFVRGNFFIPDARVGWVKPSVKYLEDYIKQHQIKTIITTGPPHSLHLIGKELQYKLGVEWIADFRDPWTTIGYHKQLKLTKAAADKHKQLEHDVLNAADQIIVTSKVTKTEFKAITNKPIDVITNGYDYENIEQVNLDANFTISHIGSLLSKRNPEVLWKVLGELTTENKDFANDFKLKLVGAVSDTVLQTVKQYIPEHNIKRIDYVPHAEAVKLQRQSQVLLQIEIDSQDTKCIIPGKLFEYLVSGRPIIALGPEGSDVSSILKQTNTGRYFSYKDQAALKIQVLEYYNAYKTSGLKVNAIGLQKYSRKALTKTLAGFLKA